MTLHTFIASMTLQGIEIRFKPSYMKDKIIFQARKDDLQLEILFDTVSISTELDAWHVVYNRIKKELL